MHPGAGCSELQERLRSPGATPHLQLCVSSRIGTVLACFVIQLCLTLCDPMDGSPPGSSVHGILQARILEWVAFPLSRNLPDPGIKPRSSALQADSSLSEPPGKPQVMVIVWKDRSENPQKTSPKPGSFFLSFLSCLVSCERCRANKGPGPTAVLRSQIIQVLVDTPDL